MSNKIYWEFPEQAPTLAGEQLPIEFTDSEFSTFKTAVEESGVETGQFAIKADQWASQNRPEIKDQIVDRYKPKLARRRESQRDELQREMWQAIIKKRIMAFAEFLTDDSNPLYGVN
jgi:hypothetical protein